MMFEGRNIHYSSTDNKLLCSYSTKLCRLRRLTGYGFCCRHILEDPSAPFKRCIYVRNKYRCGIPVQKNKESDLCNKHEQKLNSAHVLVKQETHLGPISIPSPELSPLQNGISPTPPSTPTHDPSRMSLMDRIKSKFTRVQSCPSEDMIVNVEDDVDPYAFPDTDSTLEKSCVSTDSQVGTPHDVDVSGNLADIFGSSVSSTISAMNVPQSECVSPSYSFGTSLSISNSLPPTPPSGETPIAKMYPELLGKLHSSPPSLFDRSPSVTVARTAAKQTCCTVVVAQKPRVTCGKLPAQTAGKTPRSPKPSGNRSGSTGKTRKSGSASENSKLGPLTGSIHSSRTMNKLQNKIAQNKIQDKIRSKAKQKEAIVSPQDSILSLVSAALPALQTGLSSSVTSTIFSLGSIPSLGTFLATPCAGISSKGQYSSGKVITPLAVPVALPLLTNQPLLSPNNTGGIPMVIPATMFTPFPNLAGALNILQKKDNDHYKNGVKTVSKSSKAKSRGSKISNVSREGLKLTIKKSAMKSKKLKSKASIRNVCDTGNEIIDHLNTQCVPATDGILSSSVPQVSSQIATHCIPSNSHACRQQKSVSHTLKKKKKSSTKKASRRPKSLALKSCHDVGLVPQVLTEFSVVESHTIPNEERVSKHSQKDRKDNKSYSAEVGSAICEGIVNSKQSSSPNFTSCPESEFTNKMRVKREVKASHKVALVRPNLKRLNQSLMTEFEVKKKFRRKSAWNCYKVYAKCHRGDSTLLPFGVDSSSDDESAGLMSLQRDPLVFSCDEKITDNELYDKNLLSTIRTTQESLVRSKYRRRLSELQRHNRLTRNFHSNHNQTTLALLDIAKRSAAGASEFVLATNRRTDYKEYRSKKAEYRDDVVPQRQCLITDKETDKICTKPALPSTNHCMKHIMYNVDQKLFDYCTAKFVNNRQCCVSVFDVTHELPLCSEHARKFDNYQRSQEERLVRKPRKKTKPSALTRPPKKGKKRKKVVHKIDLDDAMMTKSNIMEHCLDLPSSDTEKGEGLETNLAALPSQSDSHDDDMVQQERIHHQVLTHIPDGLDSDIDEPFSPGMIEKNLDLPLDFEDATKLLDKHDLDMLNKMPDEAFDLFAAVSEKHEQLTPTKEEADMLEKAIAEASNNLNLHQHVDLPTLTRDDLTKLTTMERVHSNPPADYMSDNDEKADELTKQIASSLMHRNPLCDDEDDLDHDSLNNLASSLTPHDLRSISQALIGSDIDIGLVTSEHSHVANGLTSSENCHTVTGYMENQNSHLVTAGNTTSNSCRMFNSEVQICGLESTYSDQLQAVCTQMPLQPQCLTSNYLSSIQCQTLATQGPEIAPQGQMVPIESQTSTPIQQISTNCTANDSSQLSQLLSHQNLAIHNNSNSQNALQENIRVFLNASSGTQSLNACETITAAGSVSTPHSILHDFLTRTNTNSSVLSAGGSLSDDITSSPMQSSPIVDITASAQQPVTTSHTEVNLEQLNKQLQLQFNTSQTAINQSILNAINALNANQNAQASNCGSNTSQSFVFSLPDCRTLGVPNVSLRPGSRPEPIPGVHKITSASSLHLSSHSSQRLQVPAVLNSHSEQSHLFNHNALPPSVILANQSLPTPISPNQVLALQPTFSRNSTVTPTQICKTSVLTNQNAASIPAPIMSSRPSETRLKLSNVENQQQVLSQLLPHLKSSIQIKTDQSQCSVASTNSQAAAVLPSPNSLVQSMTSTQLMGTIIDAMKCQLPPNAIVSSIPLNAPESNPGAAVSIENSVQIDPNDAVHSLESKSVLPSNNALQHVLANSNIAQQQNSLNVQILQALTVANTQLPTNIVNCKSIPKQKSTQRNDRVTYQQKSAAPTNLVDVQLLSHPGSHSNNIFINQPQDNVAIPPNPKTSGSSGQSRKVSKSTAVVKTKSRRRSQAKNAVIMQPSVSQFHSNKIKSFPTKQTIQTQVHSNAPTTQVMPINANLQHIMPKQSSTNQPFAITSLPGVGTLTQLPNGLQQALLAALQAQSQSAVQAGLGLKVPYPIQTLQIPTGFQVLTNTSVHPQGVTMASQPMSTHPFLTIAAMSQSKPPVSVKVHTTDSNASH